LDEQTADLLIKIPESSRRFCRKLLITNSAPAEYTVADLLLSRQECLSLFKAV